MASAIAAGNSIINPTTNVFCRLTLQTPQASMFLPSSSQTQQPSSQTQQPSSLIQQSSSPLIFSAKVPITKDRIRNVKLLLKRRIAFNTAQHFVRTKDQ
ncbi:hypothetical protein YC2023_073609 [Brassica napus]